MKRLLIIPTLLLCISAFGQFTKTQLYTNINENIRLKTYSPTRISAVLDSIVATMNTGGGGGAFTDLSDVPNSYSGQGSKLVRVNAGATALEFFTPTYLSGVVSIANGGTGLSTLGTANQLLRVNAGATALEYFTPSYISSYPGAGIPVSTGSAWGPSITDNSTNWNTAFGWGNHASAGYASQAYANAKVADALNDGVTTIAPSQNAVYDAIAAISGYTSTTPEIIYASITGQTMKGRVLTLNHIFRDIDGTTEGATTFQWVRADDSSGTGVADISGATSSTYTLVTGDVTKYIACKVTPVNTTPESGSVYTTSYVGAVDDTYYPADNANVIVSYGIKKMASAYAGPCIRVQLSSGGATTDIGFDANGDVDWAAVQTAASSGVIYLNRWYDQSGNGFNMLFTTFANQPQVDYTNKRIIWSPTNTGYVTHNSTMDIGTGDFSMFLEATQKILKDATFSFVTKQTSYSANNIQLYSPIGVGVLLYSGNAGSNSMQASYATPERRTVISAYRNATTKYINTDGVVKSASETATNLTSTANINFNAGDGGAGDWLMWSFSLFKQNYGSDYSKYKKFVSAD